MEVTLEGRLKAFDRCCKFESRYYYSVSVYVFLPGPDFIAKLPKYATHNFYPCTITVSTNALIPLVAYL